MLQTNGISYLEIRNGLPVLTSEAGERMADIIRRKKEIEAEEKAFKAYLLDLMEKNNIIKAETETVSFTYKAPYDRETFDSKKFRDDHPDIYDEYAVISPVKASVMVKVKK